MMQLLLLVVLLFNCATSSFLGVRRLFTGAGAAYSGGSYGGGYDSYGSTSGSSVDPASDDANTLAANFPASLFTPLNLEAAGAYHITGYNGVKATYPYNYSVKPIVSFSSFTIDPAQKKLVFNQGEEGNEYVFENGTYITLNVSSDPSVPLICTYVPYVNYTQEVAAIANLTLQDIYFQRSFQTASGAQSCGSQGTTGFSKVNLFSGITVDASSCGTMIAFTISTFGKGFLRGIYAMEPFHSAPNGTPTNVFVATSALIFDPSTLTRGVPSPSLFQLPASCFPAGGGTPLNYCLALGGGVAPNLNPVCDLFPLPQ